MEKIDFWQKAWVQDQGLPHNDWAGILCTQKLPSTNLTTLESFIPIDLTIQKLTNIFQNVEYLTPGYPEGGLKSKNKKICVS